MNALLRAWTWTIVPVAAAIGLLSCGSDSKPNGSSPVDAGADVSKPNDAGADTATTDASADAGADGPVADAKLDGYADAAADGADASSDAGQDGGSCTADPPVGDDGVRTILVTHPMGPSADACGRMVRVLRIEGAVLSDTGAQLELGDCPQRVKFAPDGRLALVINNSGQTSSISVLRNDAAGLVSIAGELELPQISNPVDIAFTSDGHNALIADDVAGAQGGVHVLSIEPGCAASYEKTIALSGAKAVQPLGAGFALAIGGEAPADTAILDLAAGAVVAGHDLFLAAVEPSALALSPDGKTLVVPNASAYSALADTVSVLEISGGGAAPVASLVQQLAGITDPAGSVFSPDGALLAVANTSSDTVTWLKMASPGKLTQAGNVEGVPLASRVAMLSRGTHAGLVLVSSVTSLRMLEFEGDGIVDLGKFTIGSGNGAIVGDVAIEP